MIFNQLLANSLIIGSIYALVACGFSLIYSTNRFLNLAHGACVLVSAYMLYWIFAVLNVPFYLACILTIAISGALGFGMFRLVFLPLQKRKSSNIILLLSSVGLLILFENLTLLLFGADIKTIGYVKVAKGMEILGAIITPLQIVIVAISLILLILIYIFMKKTKLGRNMRAVSDNRELADIMGINSRKIADYSFIIGSALAGVAGILIALEQNLEPTMGMNLMIKGFTGAIVGGITSVPGSIIGSYLLGIAENFGIWWLPSGYKDAIAFIVLFLFLLLKPTGLFGIDKGVKK